jgi:hypothetical protein
MLVWVAWLPEVGIIRRDHHRKSGAKCGPLRSVLKLRIVTVFTIRYFPQSTFYGGVVITPISTIDAHFRGFVSLLEEPDPHAPIILSISWNKDRDSFSIFQNLQYTQPVEKPKVLMRFLGAQPQSLNTMKISTLSDFAEDGVKFGGPAGQRYSRTFYKNPASKNT